jgi:hypothetical protein
MNPAPGYDDHIPHDLVHYVVEAELKLGAGVFGRAARGGSSFIAAVEAGGNARDRRRQLRRQRKREARLSEQDDGGAREMMRAERLALLCDIEWRRRHGQRGNGLAGVRVDPPTPEEAREVERIVARLEGLGTAWNALPNGGSLVFVWPGVHAVGAEG